MCRYRSKYSQQPGSRAVAACAASGIARRAGRAVLLAVALLAARSGVVLAQPSTPASPGAVPPLVRLVVPFSAGASNDVIARGLAPGLAKRLGTTVIVENRPGAAGVLGASFVAKAPHDGSVLLLTSSTLLTAAATQPGSPYDPLTAFAPVAMVADGPMLLAVSAAMPARTPAEVLAAARARPGRITYGSAGVGSLGQLATELMCVSSGVTMMHVPYKGASGALVDLAAGQIDVMISNYSSLAMLIKSGKVRPLAVTSRERNPAFPDLPPLAASVSGYVADIWVGVLAPAGTPAPLVERLNREIAAVAASDDLKATLAQDGAKPSSAGAAAFGERMKQDLALWKRIAAERRIVAE